MIKNFADNVVGLIWIAVLLCAAYVVYEESYEAGLIEGFNHGYSMGFIEADKAPGGTLKDLADMHHLHILELINSDDTTEEFRDYLKRMLMRTPMSEKSFLPRNQE